MLKKYLNLLIDWLPSILWMATIFFFSARHEFQIASQPTSNFFIFKLLHMSEYGGLYVLLTRAFYRSGFTIKRALLYSFIIASIYAVSDEIHQIFTPTRDGRLRDAIVDITGITFTYILITHKMHFFKKVIIN